VLSLKYIKLEYKSFIFIPHDAGEVEM